MAMFQSGSSASGAPYFPNTVGSNAGSPSTQGLFNPFQTAYSPGGDPFRTAYVVPPSQGVGSPASSSYMVHAAEVTSVHADELVRSLAQQREAEVQSATAVTVRQLPPKTPFLGDRGSLTQSPPIVASVPATRPASAVGSAAQVTVVTAPPAELAGLAQEVAAKEMELRVLRQQAETTQRDADRLRTQLRDANLRLQQASGDVGTLAAKVEATAGRTHTVLDASKAQIQEQVEGFQRRLARMTFELEEKDEDVAQLKVVVAQAQAKVSGHGDRVAAVQQGQYVEETTGAGMETTKAFGDWKDVSKARIDQEKANTALAREVRAAREEHDRVDEEINDTRKRIHNIEQKCRYHESELARRKQHFDALVMEERLCQSAAVLGAERAAEQKRNHAAEKRWLDQRIADEKGSRAGKSAKAQAYDAAEQEALKAQMQLQALTMCVKEISRTLRGPSGGAGDHVDRLDHEVDAWFQKARADARPVPALQRVSAGEYWLDGRPVDLAVSDSGKLCARVSDGGLLPVEAYFRHLEALKKQDVPSPTVAQPKMATATYGVEPGPKPLHALVSPMTIRMTSPVA